MANELYIYTTPAESHVQLKLDSGNVLVAQGPFTANGRADAHLMTLPTGVPAQGGVLEVSHEGFTDFANRGLVVPSTSAPALFMLDDVRLVAVPGPEPPPPGPNPNANPLDILNAVYATGLYNLATKEGCGKFTEAGCEALHGQHSPWWGHILKPDPGQNQFNGHAVDAVQLAANAGSTPQGIYDIIHDSESANASVVFNRKSDADLNLWYYPADAGAGLRMVVVPEPLWRKLIAKTAGFLAWLHKAAMK